MKDLQAKYLNDSLTVDELKQLRLEESNQSDTLIEQALMESWFQVVNTVDNTELKASVGNIVKKRSKILPLRKVLKYAAILAMPLLSIPFVKYYMQMQQVASQEVILSAASNERASIALPDGTIVQLNANSRLAYIPSNFTDSKRMVSFEGEGYFDVKTDSTKPFIISSDMLEIRVFGTSFNFKAQSEADHMSLLLVEGKVEIHNTINKEVFKVAPSQKVHFDKQTQQFKIEREACDQSNIPWIQQYLEFNSAPLSVVLDAISQKYDMSVNLEGDQAMLYESFTGRIPGKDIDEAISILKYTFDLNCIRADENVTFTIRK